MENLAFHSFTQMQDSYTSNSHYLTYTLLFKVVRMYVLNLGMKGISMDGRTQNTADTDHHATQYVPGRIGSTFSWTEAPTVSPQ